MMNEASSRIDDRRSIERSNLGNEKRVNELESSMTEEIGMRKREIVDKNINEGKIVEEASIVDVVDRVSVLAFEKKSATNAERRNLVETVKLMQDVKDLSEDLDSKELFLMKKTTKNQDSLMINARKNSPYVKLRFSGVSRKASKCNSQLIGKFKYDNKLRNFGAQNIRPSKISNSQTREYFEPRCNLRKKPIPTKEWAWAYHRRPVRQNAFYRSWPNLPAVTKNS